MRKGEQAGCFFGCRPAHPVTYCWLLIISACNLQLLRAAGDWIFQEGTFFEASLMNAPAFKWN